MQNRRSFLRKIVVLSSSAIQLSGIASAFSAAATEVRKPIPVILDTDIGDDIDDTWALGLLLKSPELDLKLVVGDYGKARYRAKLLAKFLQVTGRVNVPVGIGLDGEPHGEGGQADWVKDYDLESYPGPLREDGVQAIIDTIMHSPEPVTLICIGPMPNVVAALAREPRIARRARLVGMYGSVRRGYGGKEVSAEWNVKADVKSCQKALSAPWDITITPLDTCGVANLDGERYRQVRDSRDPVARVVIENYRLWSASEHPGSDVAEKHSSTLFDTVAVLLAIRQDFCKMERFGIRVTDNGFTRMDAQGKVMNVATEWKNLEAYRNFLAGRLSGARPM